jgi:pimeloyl-[acyl-carrier protein] methyl ester esterase
MAPDGDADVCTQFLQQARQYSAADLAVGLDCLATLDLREILSDIKVPCSLLHGSCDRIVPLENAQFLAQKLPVADLQLLEGRGHALPFTAPTEIARVIRRAIS